MVRSDAESTGVLVVFEFAVPTEPPPETEAWLATVLGALLATFTLRVSTGNALLTAMVSPFVQVTVCRTALQVQCVPVPLTNVRPAGSTSTTVVTPPVG